MITLTQNTLERNSQVATVTVTMPLNAYALGQLDAQENQPFSPATYFFWWGDQLDYVAGWESVAGESAATSEFKAQWPEPEAAVEDDYSWIRQGC